MKHPRGQAALILILVMMVASTVALTVIQRTIQEIELTSTEVESSKALQAAEAGIEEGLRTLSSGQQQDLEGASYQIQVQPEGSDGYLSAADVPKGSTVQIDLQGSPSPPTSLDIYWGDVGDDQESPTAAVEVIKYQQFGAADYRVQHYAYDPDATRRSSNNFDAATNNPGSAMNVEFAAKANVPIVAEDVLVRIRPVYNRAKLGVLPLPGGTQLPDQQYRIVSTGETESGIVRKVEVTRDHPALPQFFDFALYAGSSLSQETIPIPTPPAPTPTPTPYSNPWPPRISVVYPATVVDARATFAWDSVPVATVYRLYVAPADDLFSPVIDDWYQSSAMGCTTPPEPCSVTPAVNLQADNYAFWVQAWGNGYYNENDNSVYSDAQLFSVPAPPRVTSFSSTNVNAGYATLNWTGVDQATWYRVVVGHQNASGTIVVEYGDSTGDGTCSTEDPTSCGWWSKENLGCATAGNTCSLQVPGPYDPDAEALPADNDYNYWVQSWGPSGFNEGDSGVYGMSPTFSVSAPPTISGFTLTGASYGVATIRFRSVVDATWYHLFMGGPTTYDQWYSAAEMGCGTPGNTCTMRAPRADDSLDGLPGGNYTIYVASWSPAGESPWSNPGSVNIPFPPLVTQFQTTSVSGGYATLRWVGVRHATWYRVVAGRFVNGVFIWAYGNAAGDGTCNGSDCGWWSKENLNCSSSGSTCTLRIPAANKPRLPSANDYYYWVQTWGPSGFNNNDQEEFSAGQMFNVP